MTTHLELPLGTREWLPVKISSANDLTGLDVELAFPGQGDAPTTWHVAEWIAGQDNTARILVVEPDAAIAGAVELDAGYYDVWARIVDGTARTVIAAGTLEVFDPATVAYDRWGMTVAAASRLTGAAGLSAADLERAEEELVELMGWRPQPSAYTSTLDDDGRPVDQRVWALGRAVAWQAAHRQTTPAGAADQDVAVSSESIGGGDYAVTYAGSGPVSGGPIAPRARRLLAVNGWLARATAGHTRG